MGADVAVTTFKVVVAGPFAAGKTTFISHLSDGPVVNTEARAVGDEADVKDLTTVSLDYGTLRVDDPTSPVELLLFGTPGQERFRFMVDVAALGMDGFVLVVDGGDPASWPDAVAILDRLRAGPPVPWLIGVNRVADPAAARVVGECLVAGGGERSRPMAATDRTSVVAVALDLLLAIGEDLAEAEAEAEDLEDLDDMGGLEPRREVGGAQR